MSSGINRPFKYGANDRREFIVQNSEVAFRAVNDANGNPTHLARAKAGTETSEDKWQICKITYDANQGITAVEWPQIGGIASSNFIFIFDDVLTYTYS